MDIFVEMIAVLKLLVIGLGAGLGLWGGINLLEGYGQDNPASKSQGVKQLIAGGGVAFIGIKIVPLLATLF
ncbi:MAG: conjugal transfer protein [Pseudobutyrivibrio sp.]|nr:conjugal transfer protein [Pseudobutyrivibrio sp.]